MVRGPRISADREGQLKIILWVRGSNRGRLNSAPQDERARSNRARVRNVVFGDVCRNV
jgi:hypothetical protein